MFRRSQLERTRFLCRWFVSSGETACNRRFLACFSSRKYVQLSFVCQHEDRLPIHSSVCICLLARQNKPSDGWMLTWYLVAMATVLHASQDSTDQRAAVVELRGDVLLCIITDLLQSVFFQGVLDACLSSLPFAGS